MPRHEIIGRSRSVVMSLDRDNYYLPKEGRFFQRLVGCRTRGGFDSRSLTAMDGGNAAGRN